MNYQTTFAPFFDQLADAAGVIALRYFRGVLPVDEKQDRSPVTQADREIEQALRRMIGAAFPDHGIIGEEYGKDRPDAEFVWVIDPIDGTRAFMMGKPLFGTIIGLLHHGKPVVGLVDQAFTRERWFGITDSLATFNGQPIRVAAPRPLNVARLYVGAPETFSGPGYEKYLTLCQTARWLQYGCDCYAYGVAAMGWADAVIERGLGLHDVVGLAPILTGAGGVMTDWHGRPITLGFDGMAVAASCQELAQEILRIVA